MKHPWMLFFVGLLIGAASWAVVGWVSDVYEPFDSALGLFLGQSILSSVAVWLGYRRTYAVLALYLLGAYVGMNAYAYVFGGSETRVWFVLGMITTSVLLIVPLLCAIVGSLASFARAKFGKGRSADTTASAEP